MGPAERDQFQREQGRVTGMRDVWCWALSTFLKSHHPQVNPNKKAMQAILIQEIKSRIPNQMAKNSIVPSPEGLHYLYCSDSRWCLQTAREVSPREWPSLGVHYTTAAAFALHWVEIMLANKQEIDARELNKPENAQLKKIVAEWAIW